MQSTRLNQDNSTDTELQPIVGRNNNNNNNNNNINNNINSFENEDGDAVEIIPQDNNNQDNNINSLTATISSLNSATDITQTLSNLVANKIDSINQASADSKQSSDNTQTPNAMFMQNTMSSLSRAFATTVNLNSNAPIARNNINATTTMVAAELPGKPEVYLGQGSEKVNDPFVQFVFTSKKEAEIYSSELFRLYNCQELRRAPKVYAKGERHEKYNNRQGLQYPDGYAFFRLHKNLYAQIVQRSNLGFTAYEDLVTYKDKANSNNNNTNVVRKIS